MMNLFSALPSGHALIHALLAAVLLMGTGCGGSSKETLLRRGEDFLKQGKLDDAALELKKAIQKDPNYGEAYLRLGQTVQQQGKGNDALAILQRAQQLLPASEEAKVVLGRLALDGLLALPQRPAAMYDTATRMADQILSANAASFEGLRLKGYLALMDSKPGEAAQLFERALAARPDQPDVAAARVQALLQDRQGPAAESLANQFLTGPFKAHGPLYDILYSHLMASQRPADGEQLLRSKIDNNPRAPFFVIQLADHLLGQKRTADVDVLLRSFVSNTTAYPTAALEAADFYARTGRTDQALTFYQKGLAAQTDKSQRNLYQERLVSLHLSAGHTAEATAVLDSMLKESPDSPDVLFARSALRLANNTPADNQLAADDLKKLIEKFPDNPSYRVALGRALRQLGQERLARSIFQETVTRFPKNDEALQELANLALRDQNADFALKYADRALAVAPNDTRTRLIRTAAWALQRRYGEVRTELRRILGERPNLAEAWLQTGMLEQTEGKTAQAEIIFQRLAKAGDGRGKRALANLYLTQRQGKRALALLQEDGGRDPETRALIVSAALEAGNPPLALSTAQQLAQDFPQDANHFLRLGELHMQSGKLEEAIANFQKAQQLAPENFSPPAYLGEAYRMARRYPEAVAAYRQSLTLRPDDPALSNNLAWNLAMAGSNLDEALLLCQRAMRTSPSNPLYLDTLGVIYLKSKKLDQAIETLQALVRRSPTVPTFHIHLAMAFSADGQEQKARAEIETANRNKPSAEDLLELATMKDGSSSR